MKQLTENEWLQLRKRISEEIVADLKTEIRNAELISKVKSISRDLEILEKLQDGCYI